MNDFRPKINLKWKCDICGTQGAREHLGGGTACEPCAYEFAKTWYATYSTKGAWSL